MSAKPRQQQRNSSSSSNHQQLQQQQQQQTPGMCVKCGKFHTGSQARTGECLICGSELKEQLPGQRKQLSQPQQRQQQMAGASEAHSKTKEYGLPGVNRFCTPSPLLVQPKEWLQIADFEPDEQRPGIIKLMLRVWLGEFPLILKTQTSCTAILFKRHDWLQVAQVAVNEQGSFTSLQLRQFLKKSKLKLTADVVRTYVRETPRLSATSGQVSQRKPDPAD